MYKSILTVAAAFVLPVAASQNVMAAERTNPFLAPYNTVYNIPPFEQIEYSDYMPAFNQGVEEFKADIDAIVKNRATPDFDNTILAMEKAGKLLNRVMLVFSSLDETNSSDEMVAISEKAYPLYSQVNDEVMMNEGLFNRVKYVYDHRNEMGLTAPQLRAVEESYKQFTRNGALLDEAQKTQLKDINTRLTDLYLKFNKNLLNATNAFELVVDDASRLGGLPASSVAVAADEAKARGKEGKWVFTLHAPSRLPMLQYADDRDLRKQMYEAYTSLASQGEYDNKPVINQILKARAEKAKLLGYPDYASYMTANVMAKTVDNAEDLLLKIWEPASTRKWRRCRRSPIARVPVSKSLRGTITITLRRFVPKSSLSMKERFARISHWTMCVKASSIWQSVFMVLHLPNCPMRRNIIPK